MAQENKSNLTNILLVVISLLLLGVIIFMAYGKTSKKESSGGGDSVNNQPSQEQTNNPSTEDAGKLGANEVKLTAENFDAEVVKSDKLTVVDAYAPWCPHCQKVGPLLTELSNEYAGKVKFGKMNSDNQDPAVKANFDFAIKNGLTGYPTVWFYKNGQKVETVSGERTKAEFKEVIDRLLK
jgi:thioredoxin 1